MILPPRLRPGRCKPRCWRGWPGCRGGGGRGPLPGRAAAPGTGAARRPRPRTGRSSTRCARGWPGCRGGGGREPAPGRAAAPGTGAARRPRPRTGRSKPRCCARVVRVSGWRGPRTCSTSGSSSRYRRSAPAASPHWPVQYAMLLRAVRVSGWRGPKASSRPGSSSRNRRSARSRIPALAGPAGDVAAGGQGVGVAGAENLHPGRAAAPGTGAARAAASPPWPVQRAMLPRVVRVVGVAGAEDLLHGRAAAPGTGAARRPRPRTRRSSGRGGRGRSGWWGGGGRAPAPCRAAAPGTGAARPQSPDSPVQLATLARVVRVSGWRGPWMRVRRSSSCWPWARAWR